MVNADDAYGDPTEPGWKLIWFELAITTWSVAEGGRVYAEVNDVVALEDTYVPSWGGGSDDMPNRLMVGGHFRGATQFSPFNAYVGRWLWAERVYSESERATLKQWLRGTAYVTSTAILNIVVVGASIMEGGFGRSLTTPHAAATAFWNGVKVYGYGWSGDEVADTVGRLNAAMAAFPTNTLFVVHTGGNNVTATRPYAEATPAELDAIADGYDDLLAVMATRPGRCVLASLTYREYADPALSSAMLLDPAPGSAPYNANIVIPKIAAALPATINSDARPVLDLYNWVRNHSKVYMGTDGVHLTATGYAALRELFFQRLAYLVTGAAMPAPIPHLPAHEIDPNLAADWDVAGGPGRITVTAHPADPDLSGWELEGGPGRIVLTE